MEKYANNIELEYILHMKSEEWVQKKSNFSPLLSIYQGT